MRSSTPELLNWPLHGISLIEASAGTGKTWTLCGLYLRLLIEQGRSVRDILVVTFTTAATAELKARLRARLVEMQVALRDDEPLSDQPNLDPFVSAYAHMLRAGEVDGIDAGAAWKMLDDALHQFDEAAVLTIHSFCQRALAEMPFSAGMPFAFETLQNDAELIERVAR